jgi:phytoene dehydrogenase-like protein
MPSTDFLVIGSGIAGLAFAMRYFLMTKKVTKGMS